AKPLEESCADTTTLMGVGDGKRGFGTAWQARRKVLRDCNNAVIDFGDQRHRIARHERVHDILDNVAHTRLSKEPEVTALRREVFVKLTKLLAVVDRRLAQPRGPPVGKQDGDG